MGQLVIVAAFQAKVRIFVPVGLKGQHLSSYSWLAYVASIITIVSLLFGTFTQQLITIKTFPVNDAALNPGNVPWSTSWTNWTGRPSEGRMFLITSLKVIIANIHSIITSIAAQGRGIQWHPNQQRPTADIHLRNRQLLMANHTLRRNLRRLHRIQIRAQLQQLRPVRILRPQHLRLPPPLR